MERGNFSAAAGFGFAHDKFGVLSTFSPFLEMVFRKSRWLVLIAAMSLLISRVLVVRLSFTIDDVAVLDSCES